MFESRFFWRTSLLFLLALQLVAGAANADDRKRSSAKSQEQSKVLESKKPESKKPAEKKSLLELSTATIAMTEKTSAYVGVANANGTVRVESREKAVVRASYDTKNSRVVLLAVKPGGATVSVRDKETERDISVSVLRSGGGTPPPPVSTGGDFTLLAWNDLGMHCVDGKDYSVFFDFAALQQFDCAVAG